MILVDANILLHAYNPRSGLMKKGQTAGPLVMDAALAALAVENGATLQTTDRDFHRFPGLSFVDPLSS